MNRITTKMVQEAMLKLNILLCRGCWVHNWNTMCPISAIIMASPTIELTNEYLVRKRQNDQIGYNELAAMIRSEAKQRFPEDYIDGFISGIEGTCRPFYPLRDNSIALTLGETDGLAVYSTFKPTRLF